MAGSRSDAVLICLPRTTQKDLLISVRISVRGTLDLGKHQTSFEEGGVPDKWLAFFAKRVCGCQQSSKSSSKLEDDI